MAILLDTPRQHVFCGRPIQAAHLISSLPGAPGRQELMAFAEPIGLKARWLQNPGTSREHFDLMNHRIAVAIAAGAQQVSARELIRVIRGKAIPSVAATTLAETP